MSLFVPRARPALEHPEQLAKLCAFISDSRRLLVLTGAGVSTESGVPDYRSPEVGLYARSDHRPVQHHEFVRSAERRQQYWARNYAGWPYFSAIQPNASHHVLAKWERQNRLFWLVTQNVDNLHVKAGSRRLIELHGATRRVGCLNCAHEESRETFQAALRRYNLGFDAAAAAVAPDGDVVLPVEAVRRFRVPPCPACGGGPVKPDIVFFGGNVPDQRKERVQELVEQSDALLCIGSSLQVFSAFRIVLRAKARGLRLASISVGPTRADRDMGLRLECASGDTLTQLDRLLDS